MEKIIIVGRRRHSKYVDLSNVIEHLSKLGYNVLVVQTESELRNPELTIVPLKSWNLVKKLKDVPASSKFINKPIRNYPIR